MMLFPFLLLLILVSVFSYVVKQYPTCFHVDIEPHTYTDFEANKQQYFNDFLDMLEDIRSRIDTQLSGTGKTLCLAADIPVWWNWPAHSFTRHGQTVQANEEVAKIVDKVVLMDYTTTSDGIIQYAQEEVQFTDDLNDGTTTVIGIETDCRWGTDVTWCTFSDSNIEDALTAVDSHYNSKPSYEGLAIHWGEPLKARNMPNGIESVPRALWAWNLVYKFEQGNGDEWLDYFKTHQITTFYLGMNDFWPTQFNEILNKTTGWATVEILIGDTGRMIYEERNTLNDLIQSTTNWMKSSIIVPSSSSSSSDSNGVVGDGDGIDSTVGLVLGLGIGSTLVGVLIGFVVLVIVAIVIHKKKEKSKGVAEIGESSLQYAKFETPPAVPAYRPKRPSPSSRNRWD